MSYRRAWWGVVTALSVSSLFENRRTLIRNGKTLLDRKARTLCLEALEEGLRAVDPRRCVGRSLRVQKQRVVADRFSVHVPKHRRIVVVAVGKASVPMMSAAVNILRRFPVQGILVTPKNGRPVKLDESVQVFRASHPIPDAVGVAASSRILEVTRSLKRQDLLLCLISGGGSSLLPAPVEGVTLRDKQLLTQQLLRSDASIHEINIVRRHISRLKGGGLVRECPYARIITLLISDVPDNHLPDIGSGPTCADPTSYSDAIDVLRTHGLWRDAPYTIRSHLLKGVNGSVQETLKPTDKRFQRVRNIVIADNRSACLAARNRLTTRGLRASILTSSVDMRAEDLGRFMASVARELRREAPPRMSRSAVIVGGETKVKVTGRGIGGRNQQLALSAVSEISNLSGVSIAAFGTDGIDGNSKAAGAIIDGKTAARALNKGLDPVEFILKNDSYEFFRKLNDNLFTGPTETNVGDLYVLVSM